MLRRMGDTIFSEEDPTEILYRVKTQEIKKQGEEYTFSIYVPFCEKENLTLNQKGDELIIKAGSMKRNITLPRVLLGQSIAGAKFEEDTLQIRFVKEVGI